MNSIRRAFERFREWQSDSPQPDRHRRDVVGSFAALSGASALTALFVSPALAAVEANDAVRTVESIGSPERPLALRHIDGAFASRVIALGYWSVGDGGGGVFEWVDDPSFGEDEPANWGACVRSRSGKGYWRRSAA
jgi:hypothetical protein